MDSEVSSVQVKKLPPSKKNIANEQDEPIDVNPFDRCLKIGNEKPLKLTKEEPDWLVPFFETF